MNYYIKAIVAGAIAFLGPLAGALIDPATGFGDLSAGVWVAAALLGLGALASVLGLQKAPANISTGIK
jgi:hypothetical protein